MVETIAALILLAPAVFGLSVLALAVLVLTFRRRPAAHAAEPKLESAPWAASGQSRSSGLARNLALATSHSSRSSLAG